MDGKKDSPGALGFFTRKPLLVTSVLKNKFDLVKFIPSDSCNCTLCINENLFFSKCKFARWQYLFALIKSSNSKYASPNRLYALIKLILHNSDERFEHISTNCLSKSKASCISLASNKPPAASYIWFRHNSA